MSSNGTHPDRPWPPVYLRFYVAQRALDEWFEMPDGDEIADRDTYLPSLITLKELAGGDNERYTVLAFLFGQRSSKHLYKSEVAVLDAWLRTNEAEAEIARVLRDNAERQGQLALDLDPEATDNVQTASMSLFGADGFEGFD